jgi:hypothetical protein
VLDPNNLCVLTDEGLRRVVDTSERIARLSPEDREWVPELGPQQYRDVPAFFERTAGLDPSGRADPASVCIEAARRASCTTAGFLTLAPGANAIANNKGLFAYHRSSAFAMTNTMRTTEGTGSGWGGTRATTGAAPGSPTYNKFLAKLASDQRKPNGQFVITPKMGAAFVQDLPVGKFPGIGPATSAKMNGLGIFPGMDMRSQTLEFTTVNFGKAGIYYYWLSRAIDERPVRANRIRKSVGAENTFSQDFAAASTHSAAAALRRFFALPHGPRFLSK